MNSCAASCCTCFPKASCASATSVSWPTGDAPLSCRLVFNCSAHHRKSRSIKTSLARTISGAAPCVVDRWWSSKGSRLQKSNFVLHRSPLPHETTFSNSNPSRVSACSVPLRLAAKQISPSSFLSALSAILFRNSQLSPSSAVLQRTVSATLRTAVSHHSISIGPASAATTSGFLVTDLSNARRAPWLRVLLREKRASDKSLASLGHNRQGDQADHLPG
jgi:hypothetical protein